ncbi:hypothetical protein CU098_005384 [Rhizopus stolonifer]|uniref:UBZ4-type domain-containing protein n=1 Tax=Rhizopus stolonifer TaxID=4846 RepID=A0A367IYA5_RHIST|nr:hypothetical protein CU098_005384 [Rhizopus stolonifer]
MSSEENEVVIIIDSEDEVEISDKTSKKRIIPKSTSLWSNGKHASSKKPTSVQPKQNFAQVNKASLTQPKKNNSILSQPSTESPSPHAKNKQPLRPVFTKSPTMISNCNSPHSKNTIEIIEEEEDEIASIIGSLRPNRSKTSANINKLLQKKNSKPIFQNKTPIATRTPPEHEDARPVNISKPPVIKRQIEQINTLPQILSPERPAIKKRMVHSPASTENSFFSLPRIKKAKEFTDILDEDNEEHMVSFLDYIHARNKIFHQQNASSSPKKNNAAERIQCPICKLFYSKEEIEEHASDCDGQNKESNKGIKKKTIGVAVAMDEADRKKKNQGISETGPTNYYADSAGVLALDGSGFSSEVTGLSWESTGQTRFG